MPLNYFLSLEYIFMPSTLTTKKKVKKNNSTILSLNFIYEMLKHYQHCTLTTQSNQQYFRFYKKLSLNIHKYRWSYFNQFTTLDKNSLNLIDVTNPPIQLVNKNQPDLGLIYQYSDPQKYVDTADCTLNYLVIAITLSLSGDSIMVRTHKYILKKGWVADPYHFIIPSDFIEKNLNNSSFETEINYDFDLGINLKEAPTYQAELSFLKSIISILTDYHIYRTLNSYNLLQITEIFALNYGKTHKRIIFEQV